MADEAAEVRRPQGASAPGAPLRPPVSLVRLRHILTGGSVVDWPRLNITTLGDVDQFLRVNEFDPDASVDLARLRTLRARAAEYLRTEHHYRLPAEVLSGDPRDLFLFAAGLKGRRHARNVACILLKTIHVIHHLEARELGQHLPLSAVEVGQMLEAKVSSCVARMRADGFRIVDFSGGQKSRTSLVTKLLAKKETLATQVHDRVRFRLVVAELDDLPRVVDELTRRLFPFNYVVPGQSQNDLVDLDRLHEEWGEAHAVRPPDDDVQVPPLAPHRPSTNEFSGATYRVINFVVDIPLQVPPEVLALRGNAEDLGRVIFALAEVQLLDAETARLNEQGENNHLEYKNRQRLRVRARLEQGEAAEEEPGRRRLPRRTPS